MIEAIVYTDASVKGDFCGIGICLLNINGALIKKVSRRLPSQGENNTKAEALAIIEGIKLAKKHGFSNIRIYSDSKSLVKLSTRTDHTSARTPTAKYFVKKLQEFKRSIKVCICWVKGHAKKHWNCMCDRLARNAQWTIWERITIQIEQLLANKNINFVENLLGWRNWQTRWT